VYQDAATLCPLAIPAPVVNACVMACIMDGPLRERLASNPNQPRDLRPLRNSLAHEPHTQPTPEQPTTHPQTPRFEA